MIDLTHNGKSDSHVPCPFCNELRIILELLDGYRTSSEEPIQITIDLLLSEVKMWRAKDTYERKLKSTMISSMVKKLKDNGFQMDGEIS